MSKTVDEIMLSMGFARDSQGPYVARLREQIAFQIGRGLQGRSGGTWAPGKHSDEDRARAFLALDWAVDHGHCRKVECIDPMVSMAWDVRTGLRYPRVLFHKIPAWIGDRLRSATADFRVWRDRRRGLVNPYV